MVQERLFVVVVICIGALTVALTAAVAFSH
jgi:hypothetical protein